MHNKDALLASSSLFNGLPEEQLREIAAIGVDKRYGKGVSIFFEGDPGIGFYMVASGKVKIFKMSFDGKEQILHIFGAGEPFGEVPVFHGSPFPANAETLTEAQLAYAASDVLHLHALKARFDDLLEREGRTQLAEACFAFLPSRAELDLAGWPETDIFAHS